MPTALCLIALILAAAPVAAKAACAVGPGAIAFQPASAAAPLMVMQGEIGGREGAVVLDTGASAPFPVFIAPSLAQRLGLTLSEDIAVSDSTAIGGAPQTYRTARLDNFSLGPVALKDVEVAVVPMIDAMGPQVGRPIDAIVGHDLLKNRVLAIDYAQRRIDLAAPSPAEAQGAPFDLAAEKPMVLVAVMLNGKGPFRMEIDTGATATSLSPSAAARAGIKLNGAGRIGGAAGSVPVRLGSARASLDGVSRDLPVVSVTAAIDQIGAAAGAALDGILGGDFFAGTCLTLDYPRQRLAVSAP